MWIDDFVIENPIFLMHPQVSVADSARRYQQQYGAVALTADKIPLLRMHLFNAFHLPSNEALHLSEKELNIQAIKIPISDKTAGYTKGNYVPCFSDENEEFIYLAYKATLGYIYSNSNKLFLEVAIARGVSQADIASRTENYHAYLCYLRGYLETVIFPFSNL